MPEGCGQPCREKAGVTVPKTQTLSFLWSFELLLVPSLAKSS